MRFLADECCESGFIAGLRADGHEVVYIIERQTGMSDDLVLRSAFDEGRILLTEDKDFGELVYRLKKPAYGIILLRIDVHDRKEKLNRLKVLIARHEKQLAGNFVVVDINNFRFRPLIYS